ncbi:hypothetical protein K3495_g892 [Podosphaera aphanis]|nr:hypothetical protein K3495_g892 [Podosphaera aphanis]
MALASPTPMRSSHFASLSRRSAPQQQSIRPQSARVDISPPRNYTLGDSSDDEIPVPIFKCSALTNALLNNAAGDTSPVKSVRSTPELQPENKLENVKRESPGLVYERESPRINRGQNRLPRRKVRLSRTPGSSFSKSKSVSLLSQTPAAEVPDHPSNVSTPARIPKRVVRLTVSSGDRAIINGSTGIPSSGEDAAPFEEIGAKVVDYPSTITRPNLATSQESVPRFAQPTIGRVRYGEDVGVKKVAGAFMSVRPRRGRRHISDEEQSPTEEHGNQAPDSKGLPPAELPGLPRSGDPPLNYGSTHHLQYRSGSPLSSKGADDSIMRTTSSPPPSHPKSRLESPEEKQPVPKSQMALNNPAPRLILHPTREQENEAPPTFRRSKQIQLKNLDKVEKAQLSHEEMKIQMVRREKSSERPVLALKSQNTPRRPAPPPPKMSILDAATSTAGAATATVKKNRVKVNGKIFTRLDCIGRGGSSRVYRVMAENSKFFALKKVSLDDADESAVRGFKGEIDLLKKLEDVERVIRLYDFELNEEKGTLTVLMEMGELDMNKILELRLKSDDSKFDPSFVRHYWKEMLECLQAIHEHDIVHSDLKPHNFVLVQGRLKLIDFGIANAIQIDETVNVHRDTQIGTPNYMSPESLMDSNARPDSRGRIENAPKLMKLGKPSDVWSLGCILYQMTYGRAPFAHIPNQMQRCQAIINPHYHIEYPATGVGNIAVPASLIQTLQQCLNRNQHQRPSATALLAHTDPFLYPRELGPGALPVTEDLLGRIFLNVAAKLKEKTPTDAELLQVWPHAYLDRVRKALADGRQP